MMFNEQVVTQESKEVELSFILELVPIWFSADSSWIANLYNIQVNYFLKQWCPLEANVTRKTFKSEFSSKECVRVAGTSNSTTQYVVV